MNCIICKERPDLPAPKGRDHDHNLLAHSLFAQLAWETGIYREDNPDEWRELRAATR